MMTIAELWKTALINTFSALIGICCAVTGSMYLWAILPTGWLLAPYITAVSAFSGFLFNFLLYVQEGIDVFLNEKGSGALDCQAVLKAIIAFGASITMFAFSWQGFEALSVTVGWSFSPFFIVAAALANAFLTYSLIFAALKFPSLRPSDLKANWNKLVSSYRTAGFWDIALAVLFTLSLPLTLWGAFGTCLTWYEDALRFMRTAGVRALFQRTFAFIPVLLNGIGELFFTTNSTWGAVDALKSFFVTIKTYPWYVGLYVLVLANALANAAIAYHGIAFPAICAGVLSFVVMKNAVDTFQFKGWLDLFPKNTDGSSRATDAGQWHCVGLVASMLGLLGVSQLYMWGYLSALATTALNLSCVAGLVGTSAKHVSCEALSSAKEKVTGDAVPSVLDGLGRIASEIKARIVSV